MNKNIKLILLILLGIITLGTPIFYVSYRTKIQAEWRKNINIQTIRADELKTRVDANDSNLVIIDVRSEAEYVNGHIPSAIGITLEQIDNDYTRLDKKKDYVLFCSAVSCGMSDTAAKKLREYGFANLYVLEGGISAWEQSDYELEFGSCPFHAEMEEGDFLDECVNLGVTFAAGLADGINPCAIGMMLFLLGYLVIFADQKHKVLPIGMTYVATVFTTYFIVGLILYSSVNSFLANPVYSKISDIIKVVMAEVLILAGIINIKDFLFPGDEGFTLGIPKRVQPMLNKLVEKGSIPATILLGVLVTIFETPCSLPIYVGTLQVLGQQTNLGWQVFASIGMYNLLFVLPLIVILILIAKGVDLIKLKEWEHKNRSLMKLSIGVSIIAISLLMLFL